MRYFITGTAGFIGFHLAKNLLEDGHDVAGFDGMTSYYDVRLKAKRLEILSQYPRYAHTQAMLEDGQTLGLAVRAAGADIIVHLAAQAGVRYSLDNPSAYIQSNFVGSFNLLEAAKETPPKHLILASTSSVYGANAKVPFAETDKTDEPLTVYAATKKSMEVMAHAYAHLWKLPTTVVRLFTVYGPFGRPDMALFKFVEAVRQGNAIDIYAAGNQRRDFTYIDDLIESLRHLCEITPSQPLTNGHAKLDTLSAHGPYRVVNLGGGNPVGLMAFIETIEVALQQKAQQNLLPAQKGDVPQTVCDPGLLAALTGQTPATSVQKGVQAFVEWYTDTYDMPGFGTQSAPLGRPSQDSNPGL